MDSFVPAALFSRKKAFCYRVVVVGVCACVGMGLGIQEGGQPGETFVTLWLTQLPAHDFSL